MGRNRHWKPQELEYLEEAWGNKSLPTIAKHLNRSETAIMIKASRQKLGRFTDNNNSGAITLNQLLKVLGYDNGGYKYRQIINRGIPIKRVKVKSRYFQMVDINAFWKWAEKNQSVLDFSNFERYSIGKEPEWAEKKRNADKMNKLQIRKDKWSEAEIEKLYFYVNEYKYSFAEISEMLGRTTGAIQRKCTELGIKVRPLRISPHEKWFDEDIKNLVNMIINHRTYYQMQQKIGKSEKAIRGYVYRWLGSENLDKAREKIKKEYPEMMK